MPMLHECSDIQDNGVAEDGETEECSSGGKIWGWPYICELDVKR
jgi:hypothetical protein